MTTEQSNRLRLAKATASRYVSSMFPDVRKPLTPWFSLERTMDRCDKYEDMREERHEKRVEDLKTKLQKEHEKDPWNSTLSRMQYQHDQYGNPVEPEFDPGDDPDIDEAEESETEDHYSTINYQVDPEDPEQDPTWFMNLVFRFSEFAPIKLLSMRPRGNIERATQVTWLIEDEEDNRMVLKISRDIGRQFRYYGNIPREVYLHAQLGNSCPYINSITKWCWVNQNIYATLEPYVNHAPSTLIYPHDKYTIAQYLSCVVKALHHCYKKGVMHRNLKLSNVLWDPIAKQAYLCDFRHAAEYEDGFVTDTGDVRYMAPEKYRIISKRLSHRSRHPHHDPPRTNVYRFGADIYSLGVILYCIMDLKETPPDMKVVQKDRDHMDRKDSLSNLLRQMLGSRKVRIRLTHILKHPFFEEHKKASRAEKRGTKVLKKEIEVLIETMHKMQEADEEDDEDESSTDESSDSDYSSDEDDEDELPPIPSMMPMSSNLANMPGITKIEQKPEMKKPEKKIRFSLDGDTSHMKPKPTSFSLNPNPSISLGLTRTTKNNPFSTSILGVPFTPSLTISSENMATKPSTTVPQFKLHEPVQRKETRSQADVSDQGSPKVAPVIRSRTK